MAEITEGLSEDEKLAVMKGIKEGMEAVIDKMSLLEASGDHVTGVLLETLRKAITQDEEIQQKLQEQRRAGTSAEWLYNELKKSIINSINIHYNNKFGPLQKLSTTN